jgi:predicted ArsR family transcriptional regulator
MGDVLGQDRGMLRVNPEAWNHSLDDLRRFALEAPHPRTRERFLALYEMAQGKNATQVARELGREDETVHRWVRTYQQKGATSLSFQRPGGRPPFVHRSRARWGK